MKNTLLHKTYLILMIAGLSIATLVIGKSIMIPLALGLFLALSLSPLVEKLSTWKVPKVPSIIVAFLCTFIIIGSIVTTIGFAIGDFAEKLPNYQQSIQVNIAATKKIIFEKIPFIDQSFIDSNLSSDQLSSLGVDAAKNILSTTTNISATLGLTLVITFLLLLYRNRIRKFSRMITDEPTEKQVSVIVRKSFSVIPRYLGGMMIVIVLMTTLNTFGFMIIGTPSPLFWGMMVSLLNVIPYVGPAIGFGAAALFSLLVAGPTTALLAMAMFLVIQFIDNNLLTPLIAGSQININPLAAIISLVVWGMIWGMVGMILALPLLGLMKIICDEIPELRPIGYLIGDKE